MLSTYFTRPSTCQRYYASAAGPYLDPFTDWLTCRGYGVDGVKNMIFGAASFADWARSRDSEVTALSPALLAAFGDALERRGQLRFPCGAYAKRFRSARHFLAFVQDQQIAPLTASTTDTIDPALVSAFCHWLRQHRGVRASTLSTYRTVLMPVLATIGEQPHRYTAKRLRDVCLAATQGVNTKTAKCRVSIIRMFVRFLSATGQCSAALIDAIPYVAGWRLASLPCHLSLAEIEHVLAACDTATPLGARDHAVVLLMVQLGLRASDIAALRLSDIDWAGASVQVSGKNRRAVRLPLTQAVGDALQHYIITARPAVSTEAVFIRQRAPFQPVSRPAISATAARVLANAGIKTPCRGGHLFRHSAATAMLNQGVSLQAIGEVLRHASIETTTIYAKVDPGLLAEVVRPWPGERPC